MVAETPNMSACGVATGGADAKKIVTRPDLTSSETPRSSRRPDRDTIYPSGTGASSSSQIEELPRSHTPMVAPRKDAPIYNPSRRADKRKALEVAGNPELLQQAIDDVVRDVRSRSSLGPMNSYEQTWADFHVKVFGDHTSRLPLTHEKAM